MIVRWGVIGCGDIARRSGIPAILRTPRSELAAVADANAARAAEVGTHFGASHVCSSVEELLRDEEVNAVYIAVPPAAHRDLTVQCAAAGKHVLCEKPMAATTAECADMIQACADGQVQLMVAYYRRFYPKVARMQELLQAGRIGQVVFARIQFTMWYNPADPGHEQEWRTQRATGGGGCLVDLGSHRLDILAALLGDAERTSASLGTTACNYAVEDCAYVLAEFAGGVRAFANFQWNTRAQTDELEIFGTQGRIVATPLDAPGLHLYTAAGVESWDLPRNELTHLPVVENMVRSLNGEEPLRVPGEEAIKASQMIDAAYQSARDGCAVTVSGKVGLSPKGERVQQDRPAGDVLHSAPRPEPPLVSGPVFEQMYDRPMAHCSTLTVLPDGSLLTAWFGGSFETSPDVAIVAARRRPADECWSEPWVIAQVEGHSLGQPLFLVRPDGELWLFFDVIMEQDWTSAQPFLQKSLDEGRTWSNPVQLRDDPGFMFRSRPIVLPGRIIVPVYTEKTWRSQMMISDDDGKTWRLTALMETPQGNIHPTVVVRSDGSLLAYLRTGCGSTGAQGYLKSGHKAGVIWRSESFDGGDTWADPIPTSIPNPNAGIDLLKLHSGALLLALNNSDCKRTPLCVALAGEDERWRWLRTLEDGPFEFSYPCLAQTADGNVHMVYTHRREHIHYARFSEAWLRANEVEPL